jgi:Ca2+/Na+ antiporter
MTTEGLVAMILFGTIAVAMFFIAYRQHVEKGFVFTNRWIWASKKEREEMDPRIKKKEYRFGRNVFFLLGIMFATMTFSISVFWIFYVVYALMMFLLVYAIVQWVLNERFYKSMDDEKNKDI